MRRIKGRIKEEEKSRRKKDEEHEEETECSFFLTSSLHWPLTHQASSAFSPYNIINNEESWVFVSQKKENDFPPHFILHFFPSASSLSLICSLLIKLPFESLVAIISSNTVLSIYLFPFKLNFSSKLFYVQLPLWAKKSSWRKRRRKRRTQIFHSGKQQRVKYYSEACFSPSNSQLFPVVINVVLLVLTGNCNWKWIETLRRREVNWIQRGLRRRERRKRGEGKSWKRKKRVKKGLKRKQQNFYGILIVKFTS